MKEKRTKEKERNRRKRKKKEKEKSNKFLVLELTSLLPEAVPGPGSIVSIPFGL